MSDDLQNKNVLDYLEKLIRAHCLYCERYGTAFKLYYYRSFNLWIRCECEAVYGSDLQDLDRFCCALADPDFERLFLEFLKRWEAK